jgi:peptidoglycan/xylan/chitin deacetylase (PgdA/CDA1 family)
VILKNIFRLISPGKSAACLSILIFHRVLSTPDTLFPDEPDVVRFDLMAGWLKEWFNVLPLDEAVTRLIRGELPARAAAITFDDGYADNLLNAAPILQKHGLHATFFIATGFLEGGLMWNDTIIESIRGTLSPELDCSFLNLGVVAVGSTEQKQLALKRIIPAIKYLPGELRAEAVNRLAEQCRVPLPETLMLSKTQLRELRQTGMSIGAHTVSHPILSRLDSATAREEIAASRDTLSDLLGERITLFAYPNGKLGADYLPAHAEIVHSFGFDAAVTTNWGTGRFESDRFQLPRFTPWDNSRWRYALRLMMNTRERDVALNPVAEYSPE